jgi:hypothetical protein
MSRVWKLSAEDHQAECRREPLDRREPESPLAVEPPLNRLDGRSGHLGQSARCQLSPSDLSPRSIGKAYPALASARGDPYRPSHGVRDRSGARTSVLIVPDSRIVAHCQVTLSNGRQVLKPGGSDRRKRAYAFHLVFAPGGGACRSYKYSRHGLVWLGSPHQAHSSRTVASLER